MHFIHIDYAFIVIDRKRCCFVQKCVFCLFLALKLETNYYQKGKGKNERAKGQGGKGGPIKVLVLAEICHSRFDWAENP